MTLVLDSSATLAWQFEDEHTEHTLRVLEHVVDAGAVVPALWRYEVANGLQMAVKRGRIDAARRDRMLDGLGTLDIVIDDESPVHAWSATLALSDLYGLTVYDAAYLELAQRLRLPLATLDRALVEAARRAGVEVPVQVAASHLRCGSAVRRPRAPLP